MVYSKKFVAVVKCNGSILRETDENEIFLPFSSEYSILLKNLDTRRALVKVSIDGNDVMDGSSIIIPANSDFELIGFLKNHNIKNKFKFIKKTTNIVQHRGDNIDDGIIRIEYGFEQAYTFNTTNITWTNTYIWPTIYGCSTSKAYYSSNLNDNNIKNCALGDVTFTSSCNNPQVVGASIGASIGEPQMGEPKYPDIKQDEGITVKGSEANQTFNTAWFGTEVDKECIVIRVKGTNNSNVCIKEPITVKYRTTCETCGRKHKPNKKFCSECGTSLLIG